MPSPSPEIGLNEQFHRHFQEETAVLQNQITQLSETSLAGDERALGIDQCLAGIAKLSDQVKDASTHVPAYDRRTYSQAIKDLSEKLQTARTSFAPRQKFSFKNTRSKPVAAPRKVFETASVGSLRPPGYHTSQVAVGTPSTDGPPIVHPVIQRDAQQALDSAHVSDTESKIRRPSFSKMGSIIIFNQSNLHVVLPMNASNATTTGDLSNLQSCLIDMSLPSSAHPFSSFSMRNIDNSVIVCGRVGGPVHVTKLKNTVIVTACRQLRMHDCENVDVYLFCSSRPIIEDCFDIRFAPLPKTFDHMIPMGSVVQDQWDQVDDFKWLKAEQSPHWSVLLEASRVKDDIWKEIDPGLEGSKVALEDCLKLIRRQ